MCFKGGTNDMFEPQRWNLTVVEKDCETKWKVTPRWANGLYNIVKTVDIQYGSKKLQAASNIVFR